MSDRYAAVSLVQRGDGRFLCVWNTRYNGWAFPGGMVEDGETPEAAQARELREETGLETIAAVQVFEGEHGIKAAVDRGRASRVIVFMVTARGEPMQTEPGCYVAWKTREEFLKESPFAALYERVFAAIAERPKTASLDETKPHVTIRCPCGGTATAGTMLEDGSGFVLHSTPICKDFDRLQPHEYLAWARRHGGGPLS